MRSFLAAVLVFSLLISTLFAQVGPPQGKPKLITAAPVVDVPQKPQLPAFMYECEAHQCENPHSGGAIWLFEGDRGVAMWKYTAIANLTVTSFDGHNLMVHRADPRGTYSTPFAADGLYIHDYPGVLEGDRIEGMPSGYWRATIPEHLCEPFSQCPISVDQVVQLGQFASKAKLYTSGLRCFLIASGQGNPEAQGLVGLMLRDGVGAPQNYAEALYFLKKAADRDDYNGELALSQMYDAGMGMPKSPELAAYWKNRAQQRAQQLQAQAEAQRAQEQARNAFRSLLFLGLAAAIAGDSGSSYGGSDVGQSLADRDHLQDEIRQSQENTQHAMEKIGHPDDQ